MPWPAAREGFFHDGAHAALVDVAHGEDSGKAGAVDVVPLGGVDIADADEHRVFRRDFGRIAEDVASGSGPEAQQRCERHAMHVARGRGVRGVDVGVRIDPDDADLLALAPVELGDSGNGSGRKRVISAEQQRRLPSSRAF